MIFLLNQTTAKSKKTTSKSNHLIFIYGNGLIALGMPLSKEKLLSSKSTLGVELSSELIRRLRISKRIAKVTTFIFFEILTRT